MSDTTRRGFLVFAGGAAAAVGVAAGTAAIVGQDDDAPSAVGPATAEIPTTESFVVYVKDVKRGRMAILVGNREVLIEDPELASKLAGVTTA